MDHDPRQAWLGEAIGRWERPMLRLCFSYLGDTALAEDAVQETFFKAWKNYGKFRGEAEERTWLTRIAINTCKDLLKCAWTRNTDRSVIPETLPDGPASWDEWDDTVTRAVLALSPELKEVTLLHWYQCMTLKEIQKVLRIPRSTINYRLKKSKAILKRELEDWYFEDE